MCSGWAVHGWLVGMTSVFTFTLPVLSFTWPCTIKINWKMIPNQLEKKISSKHSKLLHIVSLLLSWLFLVLLLLGKGNQKNSTDLSLPFHLMTEWNYEWPRNRSLQFFHWSAVSLSKGINRLFSPLNLQYTSCHCPPSFIPLSLYISLLLQTHTLLISRTFYFLQVYLYLSKYIIPS